MLGQIGLHLPAHLANLGLQAGDLIFLLCEDLIELLRCSNHRPAVIGKIEAVILLQIGAQGRIFRAQNGMQFIITLPGFKGAIGFEALKQIGILDASYRRFQEAIDHGLVNGRHLGIGNVQHFVGSCHGHFRIDAGVFEF